MINEKQPILIEEQQDRMRCQMMVPKCPVCQMTPILQYDPGATWAECKCQKWAVPEMDYKALAVMVRDHIRKIKLTKRKK